jgi:predicted outer membrane repeat protein
MGGLFLDSASTFAYNQADYGGVIHCNGCDNLDFIGSTFYKNRAIEGGVFYLTGNSSLYDT